MAWCASRSRSRSATAPSRPIWTRCLTTISAREVSIFAAFLQPLKNIPEGNGSLLDAAVAVMRSEVTDPNTHNYIDTRVIVGGRGSGFSSPGRDVRAGTDATRADTAEMWLAILQGLKVAATGFGDLKVPQ
jgi:hypothetical protein